jgi:GGDEF domain-containing protein
MGISDARRYIRELHRRQEDPYLWPDFLTGLPDKSAIIKNLDTVHPNLGRYAVAYVRIMNIQPYLLKYGPDKHADVIQWAAAVLKTTCDKCSKCFVGTLSTHDFIITCETRDMARRIREAAKIFRRQIETFYSKGDLASRTTLSFQRNGKRVNIGLMALKAVIADDKLRIKKSHLLQEMGKVCDSLEGSDEDIVSMRDGMSIPG